MSKIPFKKISHISAFIWVISIFLFIGVLFYFEKFKPNQTTSDLGGNILGLLIITGVIAFIIMFFSWLFTPDKNKKNDTVNVKKPFPVFKFFLVATIILLIGFCFMIPKLIANYHIEKGNGLRSAGLYNEALKSYVDAKSTLFWDLINPKTTEIDNLISSVKEAMKPTPTIAPTPLPTQYVAPVTNKIYVQPTSAPDPDPITNCNFPHSGTKQLRRSECQLLVDCQVGDKWLITSQADCSTLQRNAISDKTAEAEQRIICVQMAADRKETCYKSCGSWYTLGNNTKGDECKDECVKTYNTHLDLCYK